MMTSEELLVMKDMVSELKKLNAAMPLFCQSLSRSEAIQEAKLKEQKQLSSMEKAMKQWAV